MAELPEGFEPEIPEGFEPEIPEGFEPLAGKGQTKPTVLGTIKDFGKGILEGYGQLGAYGDPETGVGVGGSTGGATGDKPQEFKPKSPYASATNDIGRYARVAGENTPAMLSPTPGGPLSRLWFGPVAGMMGEGASDLTKKYIPGGEAAAPYVKMATAIFGPSAVQRAITKPIDPRRLVNNRVVDREMGELEQTAGQAYGNKQQMSRELKAEPELNQDQADRFHERVTAPTGNPTTNITPEWIEETGTRIGNEYDNLGRTTEIRPGGNPMGARSSGFAAPEIANIERARPQDTNQVLGIIHGVDHRLVPHGGAQPGEMVHSALFNSIGTRNIPGDTYKRIRSGLYSAAENAGTPESAHALRQYARALDNLMARTNPEWGQAWNANNRRFANFKMAQRAANSNIGKDQFDAKKWMQAGHRVMGPDEFANSESGRLIDAYSKVMPPLKEVPHEPSHLAQLGIGTAGALAAGLTGGHLNPEALSQLGEYVPQLAQGGEGVVGAILGLEAAKPITGLMAGKSPVPQMNPLVQRWKKNQMFPNQEGSINKAVRAMLNNPWTSQ